MVLILRLHLSGFGELSQLVWFLDPEEPQNIESLIVNVVNVRTAKW